MFSWLDMTIPQVWHEIKMRFPASMGMYVRLAIKQEILERELRALIEITNSKDQIEEVAEKQRNT